MRWSTVFFKSFCITAFAIMFCQHSFAHNGKVAYAHTLNNIKVDGNLSDWPSQSVKYYISTQLSEVKPRDDSDFSGFFQVGYGLDNHSLYLAFTITDEDFVEDSSENVRWDTQDGLELSLDARHIPFGSGVASFMYSKKLKNTNNAFFDPFAKSASWNIMEVGFVRKGNLRYYEWRINLGDQLVVGKTIGLDFHLFDKDNDGSFTYNGWGKGGFKFRIPGSLGDIILMPENLKTGTVFGNLGWDRQTNLRLPERIRLSSFQNPGLWLEVEVDSSGNYAVDLPVGEYEVMLPDPYFQVDDNIYSGSLKKPVSVTVKAQQKTAVAKLTISGEPVPDLIPEKGVLQNFNSGSATAIDHFIESYQKYYGIPGVSLALIKDGRLIYHKTYGVRNTMTEDKVDSNTLFEAASVTKPVFAFAVQRLAERGVIDLERPLYQYLSYPDIAYDERYKLMTGKHVLTHRTGFPNWRWMNENGKLDLKFTPGTDYNYSGEGFEYLKMVVEKITGKKVEQVLKEEVLDPVGLYHTFFSKNDSLQRMVASGHYDMLPVDDGLPESPGMAYSMHTEAKIFTKFMLYLLEQKGLNNQSYQTMFQKQSDYKFGPDDKKPKTPTYMGMSLEVRETPFGKSFGHGGNNGDFKCQFEVYKDLKMGYVIFTNSNTSDQLIRVLRQFLVEGKEQ
ncbi:MAG TPA: serine hydrolase [Flavitalea sp.]|nr:serine hydrolase [Flavitalea sp.]